MDFRLKTGSRPESRMEYPPGRSQGSQTHLYGCVKCRVGRVDIDGIHCRTQTSP